MTIINSSKVSFNVFVCFQLEKYIETSRMLNEIYTKIEQKLNKFKYKTIDVFILLLKTSLLNEAFNSTVTMN